jgi:hypothetical protein
MKQLITFTVFLSITFFAIVSCKKQIAVTPPEILPPVTQNQPPVARGGPDQTITLPINSVLMNGNGSSDSDGIIASYMWRQIAGPNQSSLDAPTKYFTFANQLIAGVYRFELKVTDNKGLSSNDTVVVSVVNDPRFNYITLIPVGALSVERNNVASASIGNKIFYAGGDRGTGGVILTSRVDIYDASTQQWSIAELSEARTTIGAVVVGNKILFAGGAKDFDFGDWGWTDLSSRVDIYDASTNSWSTTELPDPMNFQLERFGLATAAGNNAIFGSPWNRSIVIYDVVTGSWSKDNMSQYRYDFAAGFVGNRLLIGGLSMDQEPNVIDVYDNSTGKWSVTSLSTGRANIKAATFNDKVFFAGGGFYPDFTDIVDIYDNATQTWSVDHLSKPEALTGIAALGQKLLFFSYNHVDIYDSGLNTWSLADLPHSFSDGTVINSAGGNVYITEGKEVWRVQL